MVDQFDYEELVQATQSFSPSRLIGKGSHGSVYKGLLEGKVPVAIKKSSTGVDHDINTDNFKKLENEISVLSSLPGSPYFISFLGTSHDHQYSVELESEEMSKLLVMEFMPNGSLHDWLHDSPAPPSWPKRVEIAIQIARAVQFLHEGNPLVIHRDIKSSNILFDSNWNAKLADYGLAALLPVDSPSHQATQQPAGTIGYLDPFYTTPSKLSTANDIFSYGVVLLEIISGQKVMDTSRSPTSIVEWAIPLIQKQRLMEIFDGRIEFPAYCMEGTFEHSLYVAARCVSSNPENRPSMNEIVMQMEKNSLRERVNKIPSWGSILRSLILIRRQRKKGKQWEGKCGAQKCDVHSVISTGKILLRELLADKILQVSEST